MSFFALLITLSVCQIAWIVLGVLWVVRKHDEIPLLISTLLFYVFTFRFWALLLGWTSPADLTNFGFDPIDAKSALDVQAIAILAETVLLFIYMLVQKRRIDVSDKLASPELLSWLKPRVVALGVICILISLLARRSVGVQVASGKSMGFEVSSYLILFPLSLVGVAILPDRWRKTCSRASFCRDYLSHIPTIDAVPASRLVRGGDNHLVFGPIGRSSRSGASHRTRWRRWPIRGGGRASEH